MAASAGIVVRGAGPVGCAAALALRAAGHAVALDGRPPAAAPFRPIALSYASRLILERLGAWAEVAATPIATILVSQAGGFGRTRLDAADAGVPALGYVTDYNALASALYAAAKPLLAAAPPEAACTVHAEGAAGEADEKRYAQDALVARLATEPPSLATAYERFTAEGPLALLPFAGRHALVWSMRPDRAAALAAGGAPAVLRALAEVLPATAGIPRAVEDIAVQPLVLRVRAARVGAREVYVGNAAQTLHPVAGQGLNLGLRDAWDLAQALRGAADPGDAGLLARYAALRRVDAAAAVRATDWLAGAFTGTSRLARAARGAALTALDVLPAPRRFFARRMIFGNSALP